MNIFVKNSKVIFQTLKQLVLRWKLSSDEGFSGVTTSYNSVDYVMYSDPMNTSIQIDVIKLPFMSCSYDGSTVNYAVKKGAEPTISKRNAPSVSSINNGTIISEGSVTFNSIKRTINIEIPHTTLNKGEQIFVVTSMQRSDDKIKIPRSNGGIDEYTHITIYKQSDSWVIPDTEYCCPAVELWGY